MLLRRHMLPIPRLASSPHRTRFAGLRRGPHFPLLESRCFYAPYSAIRSPCGRSDRRRRGGGAARVGGQGAHGERHRRRGGRPDRGDPARRHEPHPGYRQRLRHRRRRGGDRLPPPRHQQTAHRVRSGGHRHPRLPGGGSGGHLRRLPHRAAHPHGGGGFGGRPLPGGGRGGAPGGGRLPPGHHNGGARPVLQHPRPAQVPEKGHRRGGGLLRHGAAGGPVPPGGERQVPPGRQAGAAHPRRRAGAVGPLRRAGPGYGPGLHAGKGLGGGYVGIRLCLPAHLLPGHPGLPALFCQRPVCEEPHHDGRPGGGLRQPEDGGQISRLCPPPDHPAQRGGCQRTPHQAGGQVRQRQEGL